jgi:cytochrome c556
VFSTDAAHAAKRGEDEMKKSLVAAALAVALGGLAGFAAAQAKPDVMVKQRQSAMTLIGKYWGPIAGMASGKVSPYNADVVSRNATYLENLAQMPWVPRKHQGREEYEGAAGALVAKGQVRRAGAAAADRNRQAG